ncbi:hypothetical protein LTR95_006066 [Oleoguttula sp. CCFEE 5521]
MNGRITRYCVDAKAPSWSWANRDSMIQYDEHYEGVDDDTLTQHAEVVSIEPGAHELVCVRGLLYFHQPDCPLDMMDRHHGSAACFRTSTTTVQIIYPRMRRREICGIYRCSLGSPTNATDLRCLALLPVPECQGFYVRFGLVTVDSPKACAYFDDEKNRCDRAAYIQEEYGLLTII